MNPPPTDGYSITLRLGLANKPGVLGLLTSTIGTIGGSIGAIDIVEAGFDKLVRDITIAAGNDQHGDWPTCNGCKLSPSHYRPADGFTRTT